MQTAHYGSSSAVDAGVTSTRAGIRSSNQAFWSLGRATSSTSLTGVGPRLRLHDVQRTQASQDLSRGLRNESFAEPRHARRVLESRNPSRRTNESTIQRAFRSPPKPSEGLTRLHRGHLNHTPRPTSRRSRAGNGNGKQPQSNRRPRKAPFPTERISRRVSSQWPFFTSRRLSAYPQVSDPIDLRRKILDWEVWGQRILFMLLILGMNLACAVSAFRSSRHAWVLGLLVFMKSKDILSTIAGLLSAASDPVRRFNENETKTTTKWILSLICAYAETEEQIMKTVMSTIEQNISPHKQIVCIILDGKPCPIKSHFTIVALTMRRPYITWQHQRGELDIYAGLIGTVPAILIHKVQNAGKKDSLILGHSLFNYPRDDPPLYIQLLREEMFALVLPRITNETVFPGFNYVFCTDSDSILHDHAMLRLTTALEKDKDAMAACGVLLAELAGPEVEWTTWHLFQQYQKYTFGQYVRRRAEGVWKRVTCLPGCITMIAVRPEFAASLTEYAAPVENRFLLQHQIQYLGTDRRLTYCMLAQGKHLHTVFVADALSETVAPQTLGHYLSQRRRWASNAYFNDFYYCFGNNQRLVTRLFALIDIVRLSLVFYRVINTGVFLHSLISNFYIIRIVPLLVVTKTPAVWFAIIAICSQPILRRRLHKLIIGLIIDQIISPFLSVIVFTNVVLRMGSAVWGRTGVSTEKAPMVTHPLYALAPGASWTPERVNNLVRSAVKDRQLPNEQQRCFNRTSTHHSI